VSLLGVVAIERPELRRRQPGMAARGELCTIEREVRTGDCIEAEGVAFLDDDARGLAQTSTTKGSVMAGSPWSLSTWSRSDDSTMVEIVEVGLTRNKAPPCGVNMAMNSSAPTLRTSRAT